MPGHFNLESRTRGVHLRSSQTSSKYTGPARLFCSRSRLAETQGPTHQAGKTVRVLWTDTRLVRFQRWEDFRALKTPRSLQSLHLTECKTPPDEMSARGLPTITPRFHSQNAAVASWPCSVSQEGKALRKRGYSQTMDPLS